MEAESPATLLVHDVSDDHECDLRHGPLLAEGGEVQRRDDTQCAVPFPGCEL